ncbi:methyltransferase domain-containing protein [Paraconexibacter algicola]|uniref:Methylase n=1 Tax=Paraconexibacter algicola TaxID=2133960 RepID=A0A2T4UKX7_9ACTN|nr:methyltransferase domain-containing protein [Paraconexibacter algicola]PTL59904.1 methylase [Paraconexibacter algicola]
MPSFLRRRGPDSDWARRFPPPDEEWSLAYGETHRDLVAAALADEALVAAIAAGSPPPAGYGGGFDERVIEFPWLAGQRPTGRVLDAGSTLNHEHVLDALLPTMDELTITTLVPEAHAFWERGISYVFGDLRDLPFRDGRFDVTVSLSTLEHVGMDTSHYGSNAARAEDPVAEAARAAAELRRVTRPGGRILLSLPFGRETDHGWFRQFDAAAVETLVAAFGPVQRHSAVVYRYALDGWRRCSPDDAAQERYRDFLADRSPVADRAPAARAVICIALELPL